MSRPVSPLRDRELVEMLAGQPDLLAIADALAETRPTHATVPMSRSSRRKLIAASVLAAALVGAGVALAAGFNPFAGIGSADHAQTPQDVLDPTVASQLFSFSNGRARMQVLPDTSRFVGQLLSGRRLYVVTTTGNDLCLILTDQAKLQVESCGNPLTQNQSLTIATMDADGPGGMPSLSYGIARDGINALSFMANGHEETVPVKDNVWAYEGSSSVMESVTIHYADGTTAKLVH